MEQRIKYPIGEQDFKSLREAGCIYVDKTPFIEKIVESGSKYYFLARPRRFGKSLFLSTLRYFFEGERELFKGLYADTMKWDWQPYPVLRIDLNTSRYDGPGQLDTVLEPLFREWEKKYGVELCDTDPAQRFRNIIKTVHEKTGSKVVVLVDEYDKPLVSNLNTDDCFAHYRSRLASIYSNFKSSAEHIRLVFLTGVSRFSKLSIFSDLNNLNDITFDNAFADICGITEKELHDNFHNGIEAISRIEGTDTESVYSGLKKAYDGYRFAKGGSDIYNPWSVLNAMNNEEIRYYWNGTGVPTIVGEMLKNINADLEQILNTRCRIGTLIGLDLKSPNPLALLYQTGYLTIKHYDSISKVYTLGVPNDEVKEGLFEVLLPYYVNIKHSNEQALIFGITDSLNTGKPDMLMKSLRTYFAGVPYDMKMDNENNFQNAFYILMSLIGVTARPEVHTSDGRIDLLIETPRFIYIIELKFDSPAQDALAQIEEKQYALPYSADPRRIFLIGASFSSKSRTIGEWLVKEH